MKKGFIKIIIVFSILLFAGGCGKKESLSVNQFIYFMDKQGYEIVDLSDQHQSTDGVKNVILAKSKNGYQIEFYLLDDEALADTLYNQNVNVIKNYASANVSESVVDVSNYSKYSVTMNNDYLKVSRIANTLVYVKAPIAYQDEIESVLKKVDY